MQIIVNECRKKGRAHLVQKKGPSFKASSLIEEGSLSDQIDQHLKNNHLQHLVHDACFLSEFKPIPGTRMHFWYMLNPNQPHFYC